MPTYKCTRFNRSANSPSRVCECGQRAVRANKGTRNKYLCPEHGEIRTILICDCNGCQKSYAVLQRSNLRTRPWNTRGRSKEHPNRNQYLSHKRKYKEMRDTEGMPRHICPKCNKSDSCSEPFRIQPDCKEVFKFKDPYAHCPVNTNVLTGLAPQVRRRACGGFWPSSKITEAVELAEHIENFHNTANPSLLPEVKTTNVEELHKCRYIEHKCTFCQANWRTQDRVSSGYGDTDNTFLGTSSIDEGVSHEEFIKRQIRYYRLSGYYKDCHNHEPPQEASQTKP